VVLRALVSLVEAGAADAALPAQAAQRYGIGFGGAPWLR
jgi:predicted aspartyl protease